MCASITTWLDGRDMGRYTYRELENGRGHHSCIYSQPRIRPLIELTTGEANHGILAKPGCSSDQNGVLGPIFYAEKLPQCPLINIRYLVHGHHTKISTNFGEAQDE